MKSIEIGYRHPAIQQYMEIKKGNKKDYFAIEGIWSYEKILSTKLRIEDLFYAPECIKDDFQNEVLSSLKKKAKHIYQISEKTLNRIYEKSNLGGLVFTAYKENIIHLPRKLLILDGLENPGNIGTILRSCDGAHFDGVLLVNEKTKINQYKVIKASMGGAFTIPWYHFESIESCYAFLKKQGMELFLAHPGTLSHQLTDEKIALVIGNERFGISKEWFKFQHKTVSLPMLGCCDSLNAGVAASILIYKTIGSA